MKRINTDLLESKKRSALTILEDLYLVLVYQTTLLENLRKDLGMRNPSVSRYQNLEKASP